MKTRAPQPETLRFRVLSLVWQAIAGFCLGVLATTALIFTNTLSLGELILASGSVWGAVMLAFGMGTTFATGAVATHIFMQAE